MHFAAAGVNGSLHLCKQGEEDLSLLDGPWQEFRPTLQGWLRSARLEAAGRSRSLLQEFVDSDPSLSQRALTFVRKMVGK